MKQTLRELAGMRTFLIIWFGQLISTLGSSLSSFALGIWIYEQTGEVTQFALVLFSATLPAVILGPYAGLMADRWNRRWLMILSDTGSALATMTIVVLLAQGQLEAWHIYLSSAFTSVMAAIQSPALSATIPLIVPAEQLGRANGMGQIARSLGQLIGPLLGGILLAVIGIQGVIMIDLITFLVAVSSLLLIRFPSYAPRDPGEAGEPWWSAALAGWRYVLDRPGLLGLLIFFAAINFLLGSIEVLVTPLVLSFTTTEMLGLILFIGGLGMLCGSLVMSFWRGPVDPMHAILLPQLIGGVCVAIFGINTSVLVLAVAAFIYFFGIPICDSYTMMVFQQKVAPEVQGRVFAVIGVVANIVLPVSYLVVSLLADRVFEPLMQPGMPLAVQLGPLLGTGPGRGIGLLCAVAGMLAVCATLLAYRYPPLRSLHRDLPDAVLPAPVLAPQQNNNA
ncbi:MAG TPA: MFS transporter [Roseiflexaceae bacterium]|nr:MFS transporter [Roseiflexaceae bacterium]